MATIITQKTIFDYTEIEKKGDLERLELALSNIDDEKLVRKLERKRGKGRNDYPIRAMINSIYAKFIFKHQNIESLRSELSRNKQLRDMCGFSDWSEKNHLVPPARVYTNFLNSLTNYTKELDEIFNALVSFMYDTVEGFGKTIAGDGKYINTYARRTSKINDGDKRAEHDATYSIKEYHYMSADGKAKVKKQTYFGFRAHVLCDVLTEMPIKIVLLPANESELKTMKKILSNKLSKKQLATMEYLLLDRGYDDTKLIKLLKTKDIKPIIDIRNSWNKKSDKTKQYKDTNIVYNYKGEVFYVDDGLNLNKMIYKGYDKTRNALRYECRGKTYRINISYDERIFTPVARDSYKWERLYKGRTAVERFNGRLDRDYKFEDHNIRGLKKMSLLLTLSATVMLAMAKGHIQSNHQNIASLSDITGKRCDRKRRLIFKLA